MWLELIQQSWSLQRTANVRQASEVKCYSLSMPSCSHLKKQCWQKRDTCHCRTQWMDLYMQQYLDCPWVRWEDHLNSRWKYWVDLLFWPALQTKDLEVQLPERRIKSKLLEEVMQASWNEWREKGWCSRVVENRDHFDCGRDLAEYMFIRAGEDAITADVCSKVWMISEGYSRLTRSDQDWNA